MTQINFHVRISLLISALLILTSCSGTSSNHLNSSATALTSVTDGTMIPNPYLPHQGTLVLNDPLVNNSHGYNWDDSTSSCQFSNHAYHVATSLQLYTFWCAAYATHFSDFAYEAQMTIIKGDSGGLIFRADAAKSKVYYFQIDQTGKYEFRAYTGHKSYAVLAEKTVSGFHEGVGQSNLVAVVAQGDHLTLYINHRFVKEVTNSTLSQGQIGFGARDYGDPVEVVFTDAKVWKL